MESRERAGDVELVGAAEEPEDGGEVDGQQGRKRGGETGTGGEDLERGARQACAFRSELAGEPGSGREGRTDLIIPAAQLLLRIALTNSGASALSPARTWVWNFLRAASICSQVCSVSGLSRNSCSLANSAATDMGEDEQLQSTF